MRAPGCIQAVAASGGDEYDVSYAWVKATNGRNTLRKTNMVLPSSRSISYTYRTSGGLHDEEASRVSAVVDDTGSGVTIRLHPMLLAALLTCSAAGWGLGQAVPPGQAAVDSHSHAIVGRCGPRQGDSYTLRNGEHQLVATRTSSGFEGLYEFARNGAPTRKVATSSLMDHAVLGPDGSLTGCATAATSASTRELLIQTLAADGSPTRHWSRTVTQDGYHMPLRPALIDLQADRGGSRVWFAIADRVQTHAGPPPAFAPQDVVVRVQADESSVVVWDLGKPSASLLEPLSSVHYWLQGITLIAGTDYVLVHWFWHSWPLPPADKQDEASERLRRHRRMSERFTLVGPQGLVPFEWERHTQAVAWRAGADEPLQKTPVSWTQEEVRVQSNQKGCFRLEFAGAEGAGNQMEFEILENRVHRKPL